MNIRKTIAPGLLALTLGELKEQDKAVVAEAGPKSTTNSRLGLGVSEVPKELRAELDIGDGGVVVTALDGGAASKAGIRKGDVILMFNGARVKDTKQFGDLVDKAPAGAAVPVLVQREGGPTFLAIKIPDKG